MREASALGAEVGRWTRRAVLALTLVLSCVLGLITPYLLGAMGIGVLVALALKGGLVAAYRELAARLFLAAVAVLGICYAITAQAPQDVLLVFNFAMLVLFAPLAALLRQGAAPGNAARFAQLALLGAAVALIAAAVGRYGLGYSRAQSPAFGAILLGNTAVLFGYLSLAGIIAERGARRWIYLCGPWFGIATTFISESRGPLLAVLPLTLVSSLFIARRFRINPVHIAWSLAALAALAGLLVAGFVLFHERFGPLLDIAADIAAGRTVDDYTTRIRLALYEAGYRAFLDTPLFGHGWARLMSSAMPYLSGEMRVVAADLPQLHNDVLNFAVAAGVIGVGVYLLLIATPLIAAWRSPRDGQFAVRVFGCTILCTTYAFAGLTDLTLGFEFHTALYAALTAILLGYCRDRSELGMP